MTQVFAGLIEFKEMELHFLLLFLPCLPRRSSSTNICKSYSDACLINHNKQHGFRNVELMGLPPSLGINLGGATFSGEMALLSHMENFSFAPIVPPSNHLFNHSSIHLSIELLLLIWRSRYSIIHTHAHTQVYIYISLSTIYSINLASPAAPTKLSRKNLIYHLPFISSHLTSRFLSNHRLFN